MTKTSAVLRSWRRLRGMPALRRLGQRAPLTESCGAIRDDDQLRCGVFFRHLLWQGGVRMQAAQLHHLPVPTVFVLVCRWEAGPVDPEEYAAYQVPHRPAGALQVRGPSNQQRLCLSLRMAISRWALTYWNQPAHLVADTKRRACAAHLQDTHAVPGQHEEVPGAGAARGAPDRVYQLQVGRPCGRQAHGGPLPHARPRPGVACPSTSVAPLRHRSILSHEALLSLGRRSTLAVWAWHGLGRVRGGCYSESGVAYQGHLSGSLQSFAFDWALTARLVWQVFDPPGNTGPARC